MADITGVGLGLLIGVTLVMAGVYRGMVDDGKEAKLEKTAKEFESLLLGHWLEQAQQAFASVPGADDDEEGSDPGKSQFQSLGMQNLAQAITKSGGLGIAKMIVHQLQGQLGATAVPNEPKTEPKKEDSQVNNLQVHEK